MSTESNGQSSDDNDPGDDVYEEELTIDELSVEDFAIKDAFLQFENGALTTVYFEEISLPEEFKEDMEEVC